MKGIVFAARMAMPLELTLPKVHRFHNLMDASYRQTVICN